MDASVKPLLTTILQATSTPQAGRSVWENGACVRARMLGRRWPIQDREFAARQQAALADHGLTPEEVASAMAPLFCAQAELAEATALFAGARRGHLPTRSRLDDLGRLLISLRVARGWTQRQLAGRLLEINQLPSVTRPVVEAARESLVIGTT